MSDNKFDAPLTAIRKDMRAAIAVCQGTGGLQVTGDLFKDWVALRGTVAFRCFVDDVKARTDLVALIGRDLDLRPSGSV